MIELHNMLQNADLREQKQKATLAIMGATIHSRGSPIMPWLEHREHLGYRKMSWHLYEIACDCIDHIGEKVTEAERESETQCAVWWAVEKDMYTPIPDKFID